ncbi:hypothetical protein CSA56_14365 [candidate division KSB3 bacterium]|uniref:TRASH domain-containing protein n=1 Tax=candidate division KSB3 bacterium TaxID=2044937 RepID=A0A2G6KAN0_9BACT|nr:MAG: hypothetical protein CSA56_14365 [candidate division KSB3 bacterium]
MLIRLLALLALFWTGKHVFRQASSILHPRQEGQDSSQEREIDDDMVKDPVCQTYIPTSLAVQKIIDGTPVYFCSEECASKFSKEYDPDTL